MNIHNFGEQNLMGQTGGVYPVKTMEGIHPPITWDWVSDNLSVNLHRHKFFGVKRLGKIYLKPVCDPPIVELKIEELKKTKPQRS